MEKLLSEFKIGEKGSVKSVAGDGPIRRRLFDMGVTPGAKIVLKSAPPSATLLKSTSEAMSSPSEKLRQVLSPWRWKDDAICSCRKP